MERRGNNELHLVLAKQCARYLCNPCYRKSYATTQRSALALLMLVACFFLLLTYCKRERLHSAKHILHLRGLTERFPSPRKIRMKQIGRKFTSLVVPSKFSYCRFCHMTNGSGLPCFSLLQTYATVTALHRSSQQRYMSNAVKYPLVRIPFGFVKLGNWIYLRALKLRTKRSMFILSSRVTMCLGTSTCLVPQPN